MLSAPCQVPPAAGPRRACVRLQLQRLLEGKHAKRCATRARHLPGTDFPGQVCRHNAWCHGRAGLLQSGFFLLENVDELLGTAHSPAFDDLLAETSSRGYDVQAYVVNSSDYGLPQSRMRAYIIGVLRPSRRFDIPDYGSFFDRFRALFESFKWREGAGVLDVLFPPEHEAVQHEKGLCRTKVSKGWESNTLDIHRAQWLKRGFRFAPARTAPVPEAIDWFPALASREKEPGLTDMASVVTQCMHAPVHVLNLLLCCRPQDVLAYTFVTMAGDSLEKCTARSVVDVSQSISRVPCATLSKEKRVLAPTVMPSAKLWVTDSGNSGLPKQSRLLLGQEALLLQGWPATDPRLLPIVREESSTFMQNLAGNAFPATVIVALLTSLVYSLDADEQDDNGHVTTADEASEAMSLFKKAREAL